MGSHIGYKLWLTDPRKDEDAVRPEKLLELRPRYSILNNSRFTAPRSVSTHNHTLLSQQPVGLHVFLNPQLRAGISCYFGECLYCVPFFQISY